MPTKKAPLKASQRDAFIAAARAAECDEDPKAFDAKMRTLLKVKPTQGESNGRKTPKKSR